MPQELCKPHAEEMTWELEGKLAQLADQNNYLISLAKQDATAPEKKHLDKNTHKKNQNQCRMLEDCSNDEDEK